MTYQVNQDYIRKYEFYFEPNELKRKCFAHFYENIIETLLPDKLHKRIRGPVEILLVFLIYAIPYFIISKTLIIIFDIPYHRFQVLFGVNFLILIYLLEKSNNVFKKDSKKLLYELEQKYPKEIEIYYSSILCRGHNDIYESIQEIENGLGKNMTSIDFGVFWRIHENTRNKSREGNNTFRAERFFNEVSEKGIRFHD